MNEQELHALFRQFESSVYDHQRALGISRGKAFDILDQLFNSTQSPDKARVIILILLAHIDQRDLGRIYRLFRSEKLI